MNNVSRTRRHNQKIAYIGAGYYQWNKKHMQWFRITREVLKAYLDADDKRPFGLVKYFMMGNVT